MSEIVQLTLPWDNQDDVTKKRNSELAELISFIFAFFYYLLYIFGISGGVYPYLYSADIQFLGYESRIVSFLGFIANRWWLIILLFIVFLCITIVLSFLLTRTNFNKLRTYYEFLKADSIRLSKVEKVQVYAKDITLIGLFSILVFAVTAIISMAMTTIILAFFVPTFLNNISSQSFGVFYLIFLIVNIIAYPLLLLLYGYFSRRKLRKQAEVSMEDFLKDDGEIDMEKWKEKTWGKKPYSYDWESDEYEPVTCFSCGTIISSNLSACPICKADLLKKIEEIDAEYKTEKSEDYPLEEDVKESDNTKEEDEDRGEESGKK